VVSQAPASQPAGKRRALVVGNWKMNGSGASNEALLAALKAAPLGDAEVSVCVPAVYLHDVAERRRLQRGQQRSVARAVAVHLPVADDERPALAGRWRRGRFAHHVSTSLPMC